MPRKVLPVPEVMAELQGEERFYARYGLPLEMVEGALRRLDPKPDAVLVTCLMTYWYEGAFAVIDLVKRVFPKTSVILGGVYATLCREHALQLKNTGKCDLVVSGPVERKDNWSEVWRILGGDAQPLPEGAGFETAQDMYRAPMYAAVLGSRGCPMGCEYCASSVLYPEFRQRGPEDVWRGFKDCYDQGVRNFAFFDDALLLRPENWLIPFLKRVVERAPDVRFHSPNAMHVGALIPDLCGLLRKAGLRKLRLGVETLDFEHRHDHKLNASAWSHGCAALRQGGYCPGDVAAYVLLGLPGQELTEVEETVRKVRKEGIRPLLAYYSPIPGTDMFEQACALSPYPLLEEPLFQNNAIWPCVPGGFDWHQRKRLQRLAKGLDV